MRATHHVLLLEKPVLTGYLSVGVLFQPSQKKGGEDCGKADGVHKFGIHSLPDEAFVQRVIGDGYDPDQALHVVKMFAGTDDMFSRAVPKNQAIFPALLYPLPARPG